MNKIRVCCSRSCAAFGAQRIMKTLSEATGLQPGESNEQFDLDWRGCLGWCSNSPNIEVNDGKIIMDCDPNIVMQRIEAGDGFDSTGEIKDLDFDDIFLGDV